MSKNVQYVLNDWRDFQKNNDYDCISTDGENIKSYGVKILTRRADGRVELNTQKYSTTTTKQQNTVYNWLLDNGYKIVANNEFSKVFIKND